MNFRITPPEPRAPARRPILPPAARYALAAISFLAPAAWLTMLLSCAKYGDDWPATCEPVNYPVAAGVVALVVCLFMGGAYMRRAWKRVNKGVWSGATGPASGKTLEHAVKGLLKSSAGDDQAVPITGQLPKRGERWVIRVKNGQKVWVDKRVFWRWLMEVDKTLPGLKPGTSPTGRRQWEGVRIKLAERGEATETYTLREGDILAFNYILEAVGCFAQRTGDRRSRYFVRWHGPAWSVCEAYELIQESEEY